MLTREEPRNTMTYAGYMAKIQFVPEAKLFAGKVINILDDILFEGRSVDELEFAMKTALEDYRDRCRREGRPIQRPKIGIA